MKKSATVTRGTERLECLNCVLAELNRHDLPRSAKIAVLIEAAFQQDESRLRVALLLDQAASLERSRTLTPGAQ